MAQGLSLTQSLVTSHLGYQGPGGRQAGRRLPSASYPALSIGVKPLVRPAGVLTGIGRIGMGTPQQRRQRSGVTAREQKGDDHFIFPWDTGGSGPDVSLKLSYTSGPAPGPCSSPAASESGSQTCDSCNGAG